MMNTHPPDIKSKAQKEVLLITIYLLLLAGLSLYLMLTQSVEIDEDFALHDLFSSIISSLVVFIPILFVWWKSSSIPSLNPMILKSVNPMAAASIAALALVIPIALLPLEVLVNYLFAFLPEHFNNAVQKLNEQSNAVFIVQRMEHSVLGIISLYIALAAMPAIIEEVVFRGILQHRMHVSGLNPFWAIGLSSLVFCILHLQFYNMLPMMALSSILGWLYYHGKSLHYSVLFHALNNGLSITVLITFGNDLNTEEANPWFWVISMGAIFTAVMLIRFLHKSLRTQDSAHPNNEG